MVNFAKLIALHNTRANRDKLPEFWTYFAEK